jgi:hypothetical protein
MRYILILTIFLFSCNKKKEFYEEKIELPLEASSQTSSFYPEEATEANGQSEFYKKTNVYNEKEDKIEISKTNEDPISSFLKAVSKRVDDLWIYQTHYGYPTEIPKELYNHEDIVKGSPLRPSDLPINYIIKPNSHKFLSQSEHIYGYKTLLSKEKAVRNFKVFCLSISASEFVANDRGGSCYRKTSTYYYENRFHKYILNYPYVLHQSVKGKEELIRDELNQSVIIQDEKIEEYVKKINEEPKICPELAKSYPNFLEEALHVKRDFKDQRLKDLLKANCYYLISAIKNNSYILAIENIEKYVDEKAEINGYEYKKDFKYTSDYGFFGSDEKGEAGRLICEDNLRLFDFFIFVSRNDRGVAMDEENLGTFKYSPFYRENVLTVNLVDLKEHTDSLEKKDIYGNGVGYYSKFRYSGEDFFDFGDKCHVRYLPF